MTAGILLSRRIRRAAPLPNSVRASAAIFSGADMCFSVRVGVGGPRAGDDERRAPDRERGAVELTGPVDHGVPVVRTGSLAEATRELYAGPDGRVESPVPAPRWSP